jgi:hypothetical protein
MVLAAFYAAAFVGAAGADSYTTYANYATLNPGGFATTDGWNSRDWNRACRYGNSGQMSTSYYDTSMIEVHWSGVKWTNCFDVTVSNEQNGYYRARCWNEGVVSFTVVCQTHNI